MASFTFYELTDLHTMIESPDETEEYNKKARERGAVRNAVFDYIINDKNVDTVVISGDNADHGKYTEHKAFLNDVQRLSDAGKKVYVITATHDFHIKKVDENGESEKEEGVAQRSELPEMYKNFGMSSAIAAFDKYSYVVKPCEGYRILCLNDDGDGVKFRGYSEAQLKWIEEQAAEAKKSGDIPIVTTHHPVISPSPAYEFAAPNEMLGNCRKMTEFFADNGIKYAFTGHTHMHSIKKYVSPKGNVFYDINTGTLSEYPLKFRKVSFTDDHAEIKTIPIPEVSFETGGKTVGEYYRNLFDRRILGAVEGLENDYEYFIQQAGALSLSRDVLLKVKAPLQMVGKVINHITLGGVSKLLFIKIDDSIKGILLKDFLADIFRNVYGGDEPYGPETDEYWAIMAVLKRFKPVISKLVKNMTFEEFTAFVGTIIYDPTPDGDAYLE